MPQSHGHILWIDDEIDHLKPHILFLEEKGYQITTATNGQDGVALAEQHPFGLVLLDQFMPGMDGLETLRQLKTVQPALPVIMITKSEEEWLLDEAISEQIAHFLIKPVNPTQIFMACKQILEGDRIREEKATSGYLQAFREIESRLQNSLDPADWWELYNRLVEWQLSFDRHRDTGLGNILAEQVQTVDREFGHYVESHYQDWVQQEDRPALTVDLCQRFIFPLLEQGQKTCLIVVDGLRQDQLAAIRPEIDPLFDIQLDFALSLLPSATSFSRNAIFAGLFPVEFCHRYPSQKEQMQADSGGLNQLEEQFLSDQLDRNGYAKIRRQYHKIRNAEEGQRFQSHLPEYSGIDLLAVVVNFVDMLAHKRSQSDVLKEMVPDESGYRQVVRTWFENSWFQQALQSLGESGFTVILTSDHGSIRVDRGVLVGADRETSSGIRYKFGRNLNCNPKNALIIRQPADYRLPELVHQTNYLVAKDEVFFLYPNQQHKYQNLLKGSFQHGGISLEEMLVPVATLTRR